MNLYIFISSSTSTINETIRYFRSTKDFTFVHHFQFNSCLELVYFFFLPE